MASEIIIKGMVCDRCVTVIKEGIANLGYEIDKISLGKLSFKSDIDQEGINRIERVLIENGFSMVSNRQVRIVSQAKELINEAFGQNIKYHTKVKFSSLLADTLHMNYTSISALFTALEGITIEKYIITKRLEKVKELLVYTDLTLTQIAHMTGYSSINHLSRQFKELTGLSPSHFKEVRSSKKKLTGPVTKGL